MSLLGLMRDEHNFPQSIKYVPERFQQDNELYNPNAYFIPFGDGPRFCIGRYIYHIYYLLYKMLFNIKKKFFFC